MRTSRSRLPPLPDDGPQPPPRLCDQPGCTGAGEFRAPRSPSRLQDFYWFCLDHVRDYNKSWNFCAGMSDAEVERMIRQDTVWQRPTWPLGGGWRAAEAGIRAEAWRRFGPGDDAAETEPSRAWRPRTEEELALAELGLTPPADLAAVKARYKILVKQHHPDANGGAREAEERLKSINRAYSLLKSRLAA